MTQYKDLAQFMKTANKKVLADLSKMTHLNKSTYVLNDTIESARKEGQRELGLALFEMSNTTPTDVLLEIAEEKEIRNRDHINNHVTSNSRSQNVRRY